MSVSPDRARSETPSADLVIALESPRVPDVRGLIQALDAYLASLYPAESNHLLDLEALVAPDIRFFVVRRAGTAIGCGALRIDAAGYGEIKRMFVVPAARGLKVGSQLLSYIETHARREGLRCLRLETGVSQPEALGLYRRAGYTECGPFGNYRGDPLSVFMEKAVGGAQATPSP